MRIPAIQPASSRFAGSSGPLPQPAEPNASICKVQKVQGLALGKMGLPAHQGGLLPAVSFLQAWVEFLIARALPAQEELAPRLQRGLKNRRDLPSLSRRLLTGEKNIPIGLERREEAAREERVWVNPFNALMQFLLFLPGFEELLRFAPRSLRPFQEFADQYRFDQLQRAAVSSADVLPLIRCAMRKWPKKFPLKGFSLYELLHNFLEALLPPAPLTSSPNSLSLHPEWHLVWHPKKGLPLREAIHKKSSEKAREMLIAVEGSETPHNTAVQKQIFAASQEECYELDAFIELRSARPVPSFVAYLKVGGGWYQCDDERIVFLRSDCLQTALGRAVLLHYRRLHFCSYPAAARP